MDKENNESTVIDIEKFIEKPDQIIIKIDSPCDEIQNSSSAEQEDEVPRRKSELPPVLTFSKRLLIGFVLIFLLIFPIFGGFYSKYRLKKGLYAPVVRYEEFPHVNYELSPFDKSALNCVHIKKLLLLCDLT